MVVLCPLGVQKIQLQHNRIKTHVMVTMFTHPSSGGERVRRPYIDPANAPSTGWRFSSAAELCHDLAWVIRISNFQQL